MKNRVLIELCDKEYALVTDESEDYVKSLAKEINKQIDDSIYRNIRSSKMEAAMLTCLDYCDKNRKLSEANDNMRRQISAYIDEIALLNKRIAKFERAKSKPGRGTSGESDSDEADESEQVPETVI